MSDRQTVSAKLGDLNKRRCVLYRLALVTNDGKLRYDWGEIRRAWELWPNVSLTEFCAHFDLTYRVVINTGNFSTGAKREMLNNVNARYRTLVVGQAVIPSFEGVEQDIESLRSVIRDLRQTAALGAKFCRSKMAKLTVDGQLVPNMMVSVKDAKAIIEMNARAAETLNSIIALRDLTNKDDKDGERTELKPTRVTMKPRSLKLVGA